ncbi:KIR protein [Plasmodium coatneyi]|uniref:KIR protein n=1 Tax=Plasmodium coatneyi TaxID=208452 RepID=A0A1B1DV62_9APIC|nr:KIR protein [Plasmodium coatneyi]ANQ06686.1 KIR protein [Plasmodium coatneyi]
MARPAWVPSEFDFYDKFEESDQNSIDTCGQYMEQTKGTFEKYSIDHGKIMKAVNYVCSMYKGRKDPSKSEPYHFLYYWIGQKLSKINRSDFLFNVTTNTICDSICTTYGTYGCIDICDTVNRDLFQDMKIIFDYWYDHNSMRTLLENSESVDVDKCQNYIRSVNYATSTVETHCMTQGTSNEYCTKFFNVNKDDIHKKLIELQLTLTAAKQRITSEAELASFKAKAHLSEAVRKATTTTALSSIFGTLATTVFPFFLYKYKPWSSWFGNHSSGNGRSGRNKRSTRNEFDVFTEDSSTYDSATESIVGDLAAESSTVRSSSAYTTPSTRQSTKEGERRNNNAGSRGMVGYQNM